MKRLAFIGGTGVYDPGILTSVYSEFIETPFGRVSYEVGKYGQKEVIFMARHGIHHTIPPHKINYKANIYALKMLDVSAIVSTTAVGSLNLDYKPGELVLIDQFIDMTKSRNHTFFDGEFRGVAHVDMTHPYCERMRQELLKAGQSEGVRIHPKGTYICTEGPRYETPAEIKAFKLWGADVVGMTNVPECQLAREAEMCYSTISMVTNFAAGVFDTPLTHHDVLDCMAKNIESFQKITAVICESFDPECDCVCHHALSDFGGFHL